MLTRLACGVIVQNGRLVVDMKFCRFLQYVAFRRLKPGGGLVGQVQKSQVNPP